MSLLFSSVGVYVLLFACSQLLISQPVSTTVIQPNIFMMIVDDLGWAEVGFNRAEADSEVKTPNIDALAAVGLHLMRHYVYYECSPSRTSFQSGRLPWHVNTGNNAPTETDAGLPRRMTAIGNKMKLAGYSTHYVGKWDQGMATPQHTPRGRGYDTSLIYFGHMNDYWTQGVFQSDCLSDDDTYNSMRDLWMNYAPAQSVYTAGYIYEEELFHTQVLSILDTIAEQSDPEPFFIVYASHISHFPMQVPEQKYGEFVFDNDESECSLISDDIYPNSPDDTSAYRCRSLYHAMMSYIDDCIGEIYDSLVDNDFWDDTLFVLTADNGGSSLLSFNAGNNFPLRGGKFSPWEGGIRAASFVSGGFLPEARRGATETGMMHICDWYATFCTLAKVPIRDFAADIYDFPDVDSNNMWPLITGEDEVSPRTQFMVDSSAIVVGNYKYVDGGSISYAGWSGEIYPNASSVANSIEDITADCSTGCLFDVVNDWSEYTDLATDVDYTTVFADMKVAYAEAMFTEWQNSETGNSSCPADIDIECACWMAEFHWEGFYGPFQYLDEFEAMTSAVAAIGPRDTFYIEAMKEKKNAEGR